MGKLEKMFKEKYGLWIQPGILRMLNDKMVEAVFSILVSFLKLVEKLEDIKGEGR